MTVANIGSQVYGAYQGAVNFGYNTSIQAGRAFAVVSKDITDLDTAIMFAKAGDVFLAAKETLGFGKVTSSGEAYQGAVGYLEGWNALMTFPDTIKQTIEKVSEFFLNQTYYMAIDCVGAVTGLFNAACETAGFLENQLDIPCFKGISDMTEKSNFQALALGATARMAIAAERVFGYISGKGDVSYKDGVENGLDVAKNFGDLILAVTMVTSGSKPMLVGASALSAASKVAKYSFSKTI